MLGHSRRVFLKQSAALTAGVTLTGLSGCLGGGAGSYADWMPDPDELGLESYVGFYLNPQDIVNAEDEMDEELYDTLEGTESVFDAVDVDFEDFESMLFFNDIAITTTSVDNSETSSELEDNDYDDDEYEGYTLYNSPDEVITPHIFGVGPTLIYASPTGDEDAAGTAEVLIDTLNGDEETWGVESEEVGDLQNALGSPSIGTISIYDAIDEDDPENGQFENNIGVGIGITLDGDTSELNVYFGFEDSDDVSTDDIGDWADEADNTGEIFDNVDNISVNRDGRIGSVSGTIDTDDIGLNYLFYP